MTLREQAPTTASSGTGSLLEVFAAFLKLGLLSFGGPIAHLGYFRDEFVTRRRWLDDAAYADLVALAQFLPGPASSQVGFALGVLRGKGLFGGLAAWAAFTAPSVAIMVAFAFGGAIFAGPAGDGLLHGLKLVAVAMIAQAVWGMARTLTPDRPRAAIALAAVAIVALQNGAAGQTAAIALGAVAGLWIGGAMPTDSAPQLAFPVSRRQGAAALALFVALFITTPLLATAIGSQAISLFDAFYRSGALVFGGGHVVLPLLQAEVVPRGWVTNETFLAGYGLAQAVPGPLFSFAAYLGAVMAPAPNGVPGAVIALVAVFLPGLLLIYGTLPFWDALRRRHRAQAAMRGANAAVVGVLAAALYSPVWTTTVLSATDFTMALAGFLLLTVWKTPPWLVVMLLAGLSAGLAVL